MPRSKSRKRVARKPIISRSKKSPSKRSRSRRVKMGVSPARTIYSGYSPLSDDKSPDSTMERYAGSRRGSPAGPDREEKVPEVEEQEEEYFPMEKFDEFFEYVKYLFGITGKDVVKRKIINIFIHR
jgi:hypothetical protein